MNLALKLSGGFHPDMQKAFAAIAAKADQEKRRAALVGGVVRDLIIGMPAGDADIMLEEPVAPFVEALSREFKAELVSHPRFRTFTLHFPSGEKMDVVTAREETYSASGQLPDVVPSTIEKDLKRRDFSINAIACWLNQKSYGEIFDPLEGEKDIRAQLIRALHSKSFVDDSTRVFRAARFAGRLGFEFEAETENWIEDALAAKLPAQLTPVRRRNEFEMIFREKNPLPALFILEEWGALGQLHAEWGQVDLGLLAIKPEMSFEEKLTQWFKPWGKERALQMMTDLNFEKTLKKAIQTLL